MADEFIGVLDFDSVAANAICGEVVEVEGDDDTRLAPDRCRQYMAIIPVGQLQACR